MVAAITDEEIAPPLATTPQIDAVFEKLLNSIVSGTYTSGTRLPPEREMARSLGASRPTLREALRRLGEWNLVEPRRGSGIVVRPYRDWSIEVIGPYLRYGKPAEGQPSISRLVLDLLAIRRSVALEVIKLTAPRVPKGGTAGARAAMARAWSLRDSTKYVAEDFEVMRQICEAAKFTPGLWLLNRIAKLWFDAADELKFALRPPEDYVTVHTKFFDLIENGKADEAVPHMSAYLERHDAVLSKALSVLG